MRLLTRFKNLKVMLSEHVWLDWDHGRWKPYGKDLETALQSKKVQAFTTRGSLIKRLSRRLLPLSAVLSLTCNQLTTLPDCIGQLTNLTKYGIQLSLPF